MWNRHKFCQLRDSREGEQPQPRAKMQNTVLRPSLRSNAMTMEGAGLVEEGRF